MEHDANSSLEQRFPGNGTPKKEVQEKKAIQLEGKTSLTQETPFHSFFRAVFNGSPKDVGRYILYERLIPAFQYGLIDLVGATFERLVLGENARDRRSCGRERSSLDSRPTRPTRLEERSTITSGYFLKEVEFEFLSDAQTVKDELLEWIDEYEKVSVAKYLEFADHARDIENTDYSWGWRDLSKLDVRPQNGKYILTLPKPQHL